MKSVSEMMEEYMMSWDTYLRCCIRKVGGDGLVCIEGECGCSIDDLRPCGMGYDEMTECYPAKGKMGMFEGSECMVYHKIEDKEADDA